jgi:hypothetical protein
VVAAEIVVHHLIPVVLGIDAGEVLRVQMVRDHQAGEAVSHVAVHHVGGVEMAAVAGFRSVGVGVVAVAVHSDIPSFMIWSKLL